MQVQMTKLADIMFAEYFRKCSKRGFSDVLTASVIMHYDETSLVYCDHIMHIELRRAVSRVTLFTAVDEQLHLWGRIIRRRFVLDNLLSLPLITIRSRLSEMGLLQRYVGVHTFDQILQRLLHDYREILKLNEELLASVRSLQADVSRLSDRLNRVPASQALSPPHTVQQATS